MPKEAPQTIRTMSRIVNYEDGSGPRAAVSYDSRDMFDDDSKPYLRIEGVGGDILIHMQDVPFVIESLQAAVALSEEA
jgi:hypothetical protein